MNWIRLELSILGQRAGFNQKLFQKKAVLRGVLLGDFSTHLKVDQKLCRKEAVLRGVHIGFFRTHLKGSL